MLDKLSDKERLLLLRFVCSFVWADLEVRDSERRFVHDMVKKLKLSDEEVAEVEKYLRRPPRPEDVDPNKIPMEHRALFLEFAKRTIAADGEIAEEERENLELLEQLLT